MGATVLAYWKGITDAQRDSVPCFGSESKAWAAWISVRERDAEVLRAMRVHDVENLRTYMMQGMSEDEVRWVASHALATDALWLRHLIVDGVPGTKRIIETYSEYRGFAESAAQELAQDLLDVARIARFAAREGVKQMTLEVEW